MRKLKFEGEDSQGLVERVLVVDDDPRVRTMLNILLMREKHSVVGLVAGGVEAIRLVRTCAPTLMILDLDMPSMEGLATLQELRKRFPWLPVVVLSMLPPQIYALRCARLGARGFLSKSECSVLLPGIIEQMRKGLLLFPSNMAEWGIPFSNLSDRELITLRCLVRGGNTSTIATALAVNRDRAGALRRHLLAKLGLFSDEQLIDFGRSMKLS